MANYPSKRTPDQRDYVEVKISTETDGLSSAADLGGLKLAGLQMSTAWTAADLTLFGSPVSTASMREIWLGTTSTAPAALIWSTTARRLIGSNLAALDGIRFLQLGSISTGSTSAVAQAAERTIRLLLAPPRGGLK